MMKTNVQVLLFLLALVLITANGAQVDYKMRRETDFVSRSSLVLEYRNLCVKTLESFLEQKTLATPVCYRDDGSNQQLLLTIGILLLLKKCTRLCNIAKVNRKII